MHEKFEAFLDLLFDRAIGVTGQGTAGDLLEREEAMTLGTVIDKTGLEAGLDAGDNGLVNIAFALLFGGGFNVEIDQFLAIDNGDAEFFRLRRVK